jgi:hypothetical protein
MRGGELMSWGWILFWSALLGGVCCAINQAKNRSGRDGFFIGALLGPVGLIIVLCLPKESPRSVWNLPAAGWYPDPGNRVGQRYWNGHQWADPPPALPPMPTPYEPDVEML